MKKRNAKDLCSLLITRGLKELSEEEEEIVVDYLEEIGVKTSLRDKPKDLCMKLLEKMMIKEGKDPKKVPITAYANSLLGKTENNEKTQMVKKIDTEITRKKSREELERKAKNLPGCIPEEKNIFGKQLYELIIDPDLGVIPLPNGGEQSSAVISVAQNLYNQIFNEYDNPVIEINTNKGYRSYARLAEAHDGDQNIILVSSLVADTLDMRGQTLAFLKLCVHLPQIKKIGFTFYGNKKELDQNLEYFTMELPPIINAFSYLS